jgi:primosomal protein N' (replication factor Y) (superfamily II helicase)
VRLQGAELDRVERAADDTRARVLKLQNAHGEYKSIEVLGPCEAALAKVRGKHRYQLLLKAPSTKTMNIFLQHLTRDLEWLPAGVKLTVDVDPLQLL